MLVNTTWLWDTLLHAFVVVVVVVVVVAIIILVTLPRYLISCVLEVKV